MQRLVFQLLIMTVCITSCLGAIQWHESRYFNTQFLRKFNIVDQQFAKEGFQEGFFQTSDDVLINYYWLKRPKARYTLILASGFFPGRKEGVASFYAMMPSDCNLLFFDARGHGKSTGRFLTTLWQYGCTEYNDIIGAISWAKKQADCPIILYGVCSGAFHAAHALTRLSKKEMQNYDIRGLVFDSGWRSVIEIAKTGGWSEIEKILKKKYKDQSSNLKKITYSLISNGAYGFLSVAYHLIIKPVLWFTKSTTDLQTKIAAISIPIFYIHAGDDNYAPIDGVKALADNTRQKKTWWIESPSKHAAHHLKYKHAYRTKMLAFIEDVLH